MTSSINLARTPLSRSLALQGRVIAALLMREILTRYGRHNIGFIWLFFEPMLFTLGVMTLWTYAKTAHGGSGISIVAFAITGYSSVLIWRNSTSRCSKAIEPNLSLLFHRNVRVIDVFISRLLLEIAGATISFILLSTIFTSVGAMKPPNDLLTIVIAWFLLIALAAGLGLCVGALTERSETFERIWHPVTYLLFPMSGAAFMVQWLPASFKKVVLWLPMVHGVEMLRHGFFGQAVKTYEDPLYMGAWCLGLLLVGLLLVRETARRVEPE